MERFAHSRSGAATRWPLRLLPLWDVIMVLLCARIASLVDSALPASVPTAIWTWTPAERWALPLALLAPFLMHRPGAAPSVRAALVRALAFAGVAAVAGALAADPPPAVWLALWLGACVLALPALRRLLASPAGVQTVAVVGAGPVADRLIRHLRRYDGGRFRLVGVFDDRGTRIEDCENAPRGTVADLLEMGERQRVDWIMITLPGTARVRVLQLLGSLRGVADTVGLCPPSVGVDLPWRHVGQFGSALPVTLLADARNTEWELDDYDLASFTQVAARFGDDRYGYVVTPNADHLIRLHDDAEFRALYADAGYVLLDSRFLARLLRALRGLRLPVCAGSDLTAQLFEHVIRPYDGLVLIGGSEAQAQTLRARYGLQRLAHHNPPMGFIRDTDAVEACLQFIEAHSPFRFCLLAVGSPQQEIIAHKLKERGLARGLALCIGASIDFLTGTERRAPRWLQRLGLEWVYRLLQAPGRMAKRYLVRGPRVFGLLARTDVLLRAPG